MANLKRYPKIGEYFVIKKEDLNSLEVIKDIQGNYQFAISPLLAKTPVHKNLKNTYLLLKYLGKGYCIEAYSQILINLVFENEKLADTIFTDDIELETKEEIDPYLLNKQIDKNNFLANYQGLLNNPLVINACIKENLFVGHNINDSIKLVASLENMSNEKEISNNLIALEQISKSILTDSFNKYIEEDKHKAYFDNLMFNLKDEALTTALTRKKKQN